MIRYFLTYDPRVQRLRIRYALWKLARVDKTTSDRFNKLKQETQAILKEREDHGLAMPMASNRYVRSPGASNSRYSRG